MRHAVNNFKIKTPELCRRLKVSRMTLYTWERKGYFTPPRNMRGDRVFREDQVQNIIKAFNPGGPHKWHFKA